jgi:hypothetical protein
MGFIAEVDNLTDLIQIENMIYVKLISCQNEVLETVGIL